MATATSSQDPSLPDPHEWHFSLTKPCPVCGLSSHVGLHGKWEHRALHLGEQLGFRWAIRPRVGSIRTIRYAYHDGKVRESTRRKRHAKNVGNRSDLRGKRGQHGPTGRTKDRIIRACTLLANGKTRQEVAGILTVKVDALYDYQFTYPGLWQASYDASISAVRDTVRQLAGTDAMPDDMQAFLLAASRADRWSRERGEQLFERGDALTLPRFYEEHYLPLRPQAANSADKDRIILRRWAVITANPPLTEVSKTTLARFRDTLLRARGLKPVKLMSPNTVAMYMARVQAILDKAGPSCWRNRDAMEILPKVPWVKPPNMVRRAVRIVSNEVLDQFYLGCIAADRPRLTGFKPAAWWRALIVTAYNTGLRRGTLSKLRMQWIDWKHRCIVVPAEFTKTGMEQIIPMNQTVVDHLEAIRGEREKVFDFGGAMNRYFHTYFNKLQDRCGIPRAEHFRLHELRKTCATRMYEHSPSAAQMMLGHTSMQTTANFYVRGQAMLARAAEQMPQPAAFCNGHAPESAPVNGRKDRP